MPVTEETAEVASPGRRPARRWLVAAREVAVVVMLVAATGDVIQSNWALRPIRYQQPAVLAALVDFPRLKQDWLMFTPETPPDDFMISVEAVTAAGRLVDPYNEIASRQRTARFEAIPTRLDQDQFFGNYTLFAARIDLHRYYPALQRWILRYPERTGDPRDRIERFELVKLADISPAPGKSQPTNLRRQVLLRYPAEKKGNGR